MWALLAEVEDQQHILAAQVGERDRFVGGVDRTQLRRIVGFPGARPKVVENGALVIALGGGRVILRRRAQPYGFSPFHPLQAGVGVRPDMEESGVGRAGFLFFADCMVGLDQP